MSCAIKSHTNFAGRTEDAQTGVRKHQARTHVLETHVCATHRIPKEMKLVSECLGHCCKTPDAQSCPRKHCRQITWLGILSGPKRIPSARVLVSCVFEREFWHPRAWCVGVYVHVPVLKEAISRTLSCIPCYGGAAPAGALLYLQNWISEQ